MGVLDKACEDNEQADPRCGFQAAHVINQKSSYHFISLGDLGDEPLNLCMWQSAVQTQKQDIALNVKQFKHSCAGLCLGLCVCL